MATNELDKPIEADGRRWTAGGVYGGDVSVRRGLDLTDPVAQVVMKVGAEHAQACTLSAADARSLARWLLAAFPAPEEPALVGPAPAVTLDALRALLAQALDAAGGAPPLRVLRVEPPAVSFAWMPGETPERSREMLADALAATFEGDSRPVPERPGAPAFNLALIGDRTVPLRVVDPADGRRAEDAPLPHVSEPDVPKDGIVFAVEGGGQPRWELAFRLDPGRDREGWARSLARTVAGETEREILRRTDPAMSPLAPWAD